MTLAEAQLDIRRAYVGGGPGACISGLVWLTAALVDLRYGTATAFATLFFGGMLIFPLSKLLCSFAFSRQSEQRDNQLSRVALESTIAMIGGLLAAWLLLNLEARFAFPVAAIAVGTHYFAFNTAYGDKTYWLLAALITAIGLAALFGPTALAGMMIFAVAAVELVLGIILTRRAPPAG